jgi:hypothetical protein
MPRCPICKSPAEKIERGFFDGTTFHCPNHNAFDVSRSVLKSASCMETGRDRWEEALRNAVERATAGARPRIFTYDFNAAPPPAA